MSDLKLIKKHYGEKMMHLCRELFPTLLEKEGLLFEVLESNFAYSKFLYDDIVNRKVKFKDYIYSLVDVEKKEIEILKTPKELLDEAGYILYECKTEEDIQKFKKYYAKKEELCTFNGGRLKSCYVFFAVKKNVDDIKREKFKHPDRQDEYGTSVISIQFSRGKVNTLSIKNRYNHTVNNPDATFSNNLENIIEGLTNSFERTYNLSINQNNHNKFELHGYVKANDGRFYKYNYEINNIYYCPNNIIIDNFEVKHYEKEKYLIVDYFILDLVNKQVKLYDQRIEDSFIDWFKDIKKIDVTRLSDNNKLITTILNNSNIAYIEIDKYNRLVGYTNDFIKKIKDSFLSNGKFLQNINLSTVEIIGDDFLFDNQTTLNKINLPNVKKIGSYFLFENDSLTEIDLPNVLEIKSDFLEKNTILTKINLPNVRKIANSFLNCNTELKKLELPNLVSIGVNFLYENECLKEIILPMVEKIGNKFLYRNESIKNLYLPNLNLIGDDFLYHNNVIEKINLPKVEKIGGWFIYKNENLNEINLPSVKEISDCFLSCNVSLEKLTLPNVISIGSKFLFYNKKIKEVNLPNVIVIEDYFMKYNENLKSICLPNTEKIGYDFLYCNNELKEINMPKLTEIGYGFLYSSTRLIKINLPNVKKIEDDFLPFNSMLEELNLPKIEEVGSNFLRFSEHPQKKLILQKIKNFNI